MSRAPFPENDPARLAAPADGAILDTDPEDDFTELCVKKAHFRSVGEAIPQLVWTIMPEGVADYCNLRWTEYTGMTLMEAQREDIMNVIHPDDREVCLEKWLEAVATEGDHELEYRIRRAPDGAYRWHLGRAVPLRGEDGRVVKWFGTSTDIDDARRATEALVDAQQLLNARVRERTAQLEVSTAAHQQSERRFRTLIDTVPIGIFETDTEGNCLFVNASWERMFGLTNEEAKGRGWLRSLHADDRERVRAAWEATTRAGRDFASEYRKLTPTGVIWVSAASVALRDPAGAVSGYLGTVVDVTERRRAAARVEDALTSGERLFAVEREIAALTALCARVRPGPAPADARSAA